MIHLIVVVFLFCFFKLCDVDPRDQDLAEALDSGGSDSEMERGIMQIQEHSVEHRAKMWKVKSLSVMSKMPHVLYFKVLP